MKNNSGVSIITLVVTIMIIIILASIAIMSGRDSIDETSKTKVDVEIGSLKEAVSARMIDYARNSLKYPLIGKKVDDVTVYLPYIENLSEEEKDAFTARVNAASSKDVYRIVDSIAAASLGVDAVNENHYFIVDYATGSVYGSIDMVAYEKDTAS